MTRCAALRVNPNLNPKGAGARAASASNAVASLAAPEPLLLVLPPNWSD